MRHHNAIIEPAHIIPILDDVDVLVIGGTTAAVAAAMAAKAQGASVLLVASHSYLGEDMCANGQLWLEPGEEAQTALARQLFSTPQTRRGADYTYETDQPAVIVRTDDFVTVSLNDGLWGHAFGHSLQFNGPVTITASLEQPQKIMEARFMVFQSPEDFGVGKIEAAVSDDGTHWHQVGSFNNDVSTAREFIDEALVLNCRLDVTMRYLRVTILPAPGAKRILIGQMQLLAEVVNEDREDAVTNVTPMQVKRVLDDALIHAEIPFLYECYAVGVVNDTAGKLAGVEIANRGGRQVILAQVIIDATERASVARMAGVNAAQYPAGEQMFQWVVIGGEPRIDQGLQVRRIPLKFHLGGLPEIPTWTNRNTEANREYKEVFEYTLSLHMADASFSSFAAAEQVARDLTFHPDQMECSEQLWQIPPDPIKCRHTMSGSWPGAELADIQAFQPQGLENFFVLSACADISRQAAASLHRPLQYLAMGNRIGVVAAETARVQPQIESTWDDEGEQIPQPEFQIGVQACEMQSYGGDVRTIPISPRSIPILGEYDVIVVGGGTSGACAGVGAARDGAKTLVIEFLHGLGGVATMGQIGWYCNGYHKGFTEEMETGLEELGAASYIVGKMEWLRQEIRKAGGDIWFGAQGIGALVRDNLLCGVVVATPHGQGIVLAKTVIDATGNADVAAAAGAMCEFGSVEHFGVQHAGLPRRELGASYLNSDWTFADDSNLLDRSTAFVVARRLNGNAYDLAQLLDTRERRRIIGDYTLSALDMVNARTFPDTINIAVSGTLDKHSEPAHPYLQINNFPGGITSVPYRCLLPKDLHGILVIGLGLSADADVISGIRMQPDMQNQGYAAGIAAAMVVRDHVQPREINYSLLQARLVCEGCIPPEMASRQDSFPPSPSAVRKAVDTLVQDDYSALGLLMADPDQSLPLLQEALRNTAELKSQLRCAHVLGMMGDSSGVEILVAEVESHQEFDGEAIGHYYPQLTWLDSYLLALGRTRDPRALQLLLDKLYLLSHTPDARPSHMYSITLALEALGDARAAAPLAVELRKVGCADGAVLSLKEAMIKRRTYAGTCGVPALDLARALLRCGDYEGLAQQTLETFANDVRGPVARHARDILRQDGTVNLQNQRVGE